ncbi:MAG TPA: immunoglobulin-like domain-containing protein [Pyrinomonadaceae bacterium]|nr:immunoglobulin-like domain-containing protein [Pyrinomonadaceae bacterium]
MRAGAFLALFAVVATVFYTGTSSAASPAAPSMKGAPQSALSGARQFEARENLNAWLPVAMMFQPPSLLETVETYAADCSGSPKKDFNVGGTEGEQVCVKATFPAAFLSSRRITLIDPAGNIRDSAIITSSGQTNVFTLPNEATSQIGDQTVDNRGTWRIDLRSFSGSRRATASFDLHELANPVADLQISASSADETVETASTVQLKIVVYNAGPDTATNLQVSAPSVSGLALQSFDQGAADCGSTCTVASLAPGSQAVFAATYNVTAAAGTTVGSQVTVTSDTEDPRPASNTDKFAFKVAADTGQTQTCDLTPPAPITVNGSEFPDPNDPSETLYGAVVNYTVGAEGASCEPVQCDTPSGSFFPVGTTTVTCTAASGDFTLFPVTVNDTRAFKIDLIGANPLAVECHSVPPFADPGATTNRPGVAPTAVSTVNPNAPGSYTITYTATYDNGTPADTSDDVVATPVVRTVNVVDDAPPQITLVGDDLTTDEIETQEMTVECHTGFTDPGATVTDACDGAVPLVVSGTVDPNTVGIYTITYSATDQQGTPADPSDDLVATITRTIHVVDTTAPVITLNGANPMTVECHTSFTDPGATATEACDTTASVTASGSVDPNTVGTYHITYTSTDAAGNAATPVIRTVNVVDTAGPVITLNGNNSVTVECHTSYADAGATAFDACGNAAVPVSTSGSVNVNAVGAYAITYTATDGANTSTKTRTVNVVDTTPPTINCPADIVVTLPANSSAISMPVNFNVTASDSCSTTATVATSKASGSNFPVGTTTVTATATDPSGNSSTCTFKVTVHYLFTGFFSPISNLPTVNTVKAGSSIPIKFSLSGNKGLNIFAIDYPASGPVACNSNAPAVDLTEIDTPGASGLSYGGDQYHYNWKTLKAWENTCRQLVVKLNDGTEHRANFKFK